MKKVNINELITIFVYVLIGWALCGAVMFIGMGITSEKNTLIIHAIAAPIIFAIVSLNYFNKYNFTTPLETATIFVSFIIFMDFFIVALLINKSLEMFANVLGTWIPFALIFISTYLTGIYAEKHT